MKKRVFSLLLVLALMLSLFPASAFAEGEEPVVNTPIGTPEYSADTSLGMLIMNTLENDESAAEFPCAVTDLSAEGKVVTVQLSADRVCELVVAIYPDSDTDVQMLGSGRLAVESGMHELRVPIDIDVMPEFFIAAAYLLDPETHEPLSDSFISRYYTEEFQAFLATTTEDYNQDLVLNLDDDVSTNFLVFDESVLRLRETPGVNELVDNGDGSYTIYNADARVKSLRAGDSFAYTFADGTMVVAVVASVSVDGNTVTVVEDPDASLEMVFKYIKIDTTNSPGEGDVDMSNADPGIVFNGVDTAVLNTYAPAAEPFYNNEEDTLFSNGGGGNLQYDEETSELYVNAPLANDIDVTGGFGYSFEIDASQVKGTLDFKVSAVFQLFRSGTWFFITDKLDYEADFEIDILPVNIEKELKIGEPKIPMGTSGVIFSIPISIVFEAKAKLSANCEIKGTVGYSYDSNYGRKSLTSFPCFEAKSEISGEVFIGIQMGVFVETIIKNMISSGIEIRVGGEFSGTLAGNAHEPPDDEKRHDCSGCLSGKVSLRTKAEIEFDALWGLVKQSWTVFDFKVKLADFYYSFDYHEFGWNKTCPHISYIIMVEVVNEFNRRMPNVEIKCNDEGIATTDADGKASFYLPNGIYSLESEQNELYAKAYITVNDSKKNIKLTLKIPGATRDSGNWGNLTWELFENGTLIISGKGSMGDYDYDSLDGWHAHTKSILHVKIQSGVTSIGEYAFEHCRALRDIAIPSSVTSIGENAFYDCRSLQSITIPSSVTSIGKAAFNVCSSLQSITIPSSVTSIDDWTFCGCSSLQSITIPSSVTSIGKSAFGSCSSLQSITLPAGLRSIGEIAFSECESLRSIVIPSGVTVIERGTFYICPALHSVTLPAGLKIIGKDAFGNCRSLKNISIPEEVTSIGEDAFFGCAIQSITIPSGVTNLSARTFCQCNALQSVTLPAGLKTIGYGAFFACALKSVTIPSSVTVIEEQAFWGCSFQNITIPPSVKTIGEGAFSSCTSLRSIIIPSGVTKIAESTFSQCSALQSVTIPPSVKSIDGWAFWGCALQNVTIPSSVTSIGIVAFSHCTALRSIIIPASVRSIGYNAFESCSSLTDIYFGGTEDQWASISSGAIIYSDSGPVIHCNTPVAFNNSFYGAKNPMEIELLAAFTGENGEQDGLRLASFSGLKPGAAYVLLVTEDEDAPLPLIPSNLLYISQGTADEDGRMSLSYVPRRDAVGSVKLYGPSTDDLAQAEISAEQFGDGDIRVTVSYNGLTLIEDVDYLLKVKEEGTTFTATITGRGEYSGTQTAEGQKLAVTVCFEPGDGAAPVRVAKLLGQPLALPTPVCDGFFRGWATESGKTEPDYLPGSSYATDADVVLYAVWAVFDCVVPAALLRIEEEAFQQSAFTSVKLADGMEAIGARAFADCAGLTCVYIPASVTDIDPSAFEGDTGLTVYGVPGSAAETFARSKQFVFVAKTQN